MPPKSSPKKKAAPASTSEAPSSKNDSEATSQQKEASLTPVELAAAVKNFIQPRCSLAKPTPRSAPILPEAERRNVLITSALPYVNNVPHLGNIVGCVLSADVFARFCRLRDYNTLYICGTDEYGTSTETKALQERLTPRQICDKYNALHTEIYRLFDISFDHFGRTTTDKQTEVAQGIFWDLHKAEMLNEDSMDQLYCNSCKRFLADRFVEGTCPMCGFEDARGDQCDGCGKLINAPELIKPRCKVCSATPEVKASKHVFIDLPKVESRLNEWFEKSSPNWTNNARVIAKSWLKGGLQPRCITRDMKWGTPVPLKGYEDKVFYVWFDAPIGYVSITACYTDEWKQWWCNPDNVSHYEFMAKDNVPFHAVVFPASLLGTGNPWTMVNHLMATEYLNYEDAKFSKSRGIGVFGNDAISTGIPADIWRFYLIYMRPENQDSAFKWDDLMLKNNSELLGNLGNFINRALKFCKDNFGGRVTEIKLTLDDQQYIGFVARHLAKYCQLLEECREREALIQVLSISKLGNQLMQANKPWKLVKSEDYEDKRRAGSVVSLSVNIAALLSVLLEPFMPGMAENLRQQLNMNRNQLPVLNTAFTCLLAPGHAIGTPAPLVREIKADEIKAWQAKFGGSQDERKERDNKKGNNAKSTSVSTSASAADPAKVEELTKAVSKQGEKVRELKSSKADKDTISAQVAILLDLKKQLAAATEAASQTAQPQKPVNGDVGKIAELTKAVSEQGDKVRQLKSSGAEKDAISAEVTKLLDLKKQLAAADPSAAEESNKSQKKKGKKK